MANPKRIAITGKARSGKDEIANHLRTHYGYYPLAFGDKLKSVTEELFDYVEFADFGRNKPRALLQSVGQALRSVDENVWVNVVDRHLRVLEGANLAGICVTDLRQRNEYEWARANDFVIVRVVADEATRVRRAKAKEDVFTAEDLTHDTEAEIDGFDVDAEIVNDGDIAELKRNVDEVMAELLSA